MKSRTYVRPYQIRVTYPESRGVAQELQTCAGSNLDNDGYIPLANCRRPGGGLPEFPTPTYTHDLPQDRLIWKVIFSARQSFPPPSLDNGEELRIEFILEVKS